MFLAVLAFLAAQAAQPAPPTPTPPYRISGLVFGDYYGVATHHLPEWRGQQGFWLRRIYFTYDHHLSPQISMRLRLEMNSNGALEGGLLTPYVKDAYLRWAFSERHLFTLGIQPSVTFEFDETVWGLRHIEKVPLDLYRVDTSRDAGLALAGAINQTGTIKYQIQYGNDAGHESETNRDKAVRLGLRYETNPGWSVAGTFGRYFRPEDANRTLGHVFTAYQAARGRAGFEYTFQKRRPPVSIGVSDVNLDVYSGFGVYHFKPEKLSIFARVDRFDDPCADCDGIDYLPIDPDTPFTLTLAGLEYYVHPAVRLSPNVEYVAYGTSTAGTNPRNDTVLRLTFYWAW